MKNECDIFPSKENAKRGCQELLNLECAMSLT